MGDSTNTSHTTPTTTFVTTSSNTKSKRKTRGAMMLTNVSKAHESNVRFPIDFCPRTGKAYGEHADSFRAYVSVQGRSKVNNLIYN